jgi:hypothetical protein
VSRLTDPIAQNLVNAEVNINRLVFAVNQEMEGHQQDLGYLLEQTTEAIAELMIANQRFTQLAKRQLAEKRAAKKKARRIQESGELKPAKNSSAGLSDEAPEISGDDAHAGPGQTGQVPQSAPDPYATERIHRHNQEALKARDRQLMDGGRDA